MKLTITNGTVVVTSETKGEASELFNRYFGAPVERISPLVERSKRKHKKHVFTKRCQYCNRACEGGTGLASHERACVKKQTPSDLIRTMKIDVVS